MSEANAPMANAPEANAPTANAEPGQMPEFQSVFGLSPLQFMELVSTMQQLPSYLNRVEERFIQMEEVINNSINASPSVPLDNTILPPGITGRGNRRTSLGMDPPIRPENVNPTVDVDRVPVDTVFRAVEKVDPSLMVNTLSISGLHLAMKNQGIHERNTRQTVRLAYFMRHTANIKLKYYIDSHPEHPRHGGFTETSVYSMTDDHYLRLAAKTIRADNRTSDQIIRSLVGSISDVEIDRSYNGGLTNYHEHVFAKISKLVTDLEWRTNFIYLDATAEEIKLWPPVNQYRCHRCNIVVCTSCRHAHSLFHLETILRKLGVVGLLNTRLDEALKNDVEGIIVDGLFDGEDAEPPAKKSKTK